MIRRLANLLGCERGSVVVEFALLLPLFITLIFAILEFGSAWYSKQMLVNASREGARMGALFEGVTDSEVEVFVKNVLTTAGYPGTVNVTSSGAAGSTGTLVTVSINGNHDLPVIGNLVPGVPTHMTINATTVMRHE